MSNRFEILANLSQDEDDKKSSSVDDSASRRASYADQDREEAYISQYDEDIDLSILKINVLYCMTKSQILLLEWMMGKNVDFQMANKMPEIDSMSLMEEASQEEGTPSSSQEKSWECPVITCTKSYRFEKHLRNHTKKVHDLELDESFNPQEASTYDEDFSTQLPVSGRKRKVRDEDSDDEERGEKPKREGRLDSIKEEDNEALDYKLLDDSVDMNTQEVREAARDAIRKAEEADVSVNGLDDSLEKEEAQNLEEARQKLKTKDDLLHIRNAKIAELEAEIEENREVNDQMTRALKKVKVEREELKRKAKKDIEEKERLIKGMMSKLVKLEKRSVSPGKDQLKDDLEKATVKINNLTNRVTNLSKDLKNATKDRRKAEMDTNNYEKMRASLERTVLEMEGIKRDLDEHKREKAKIMKRIPCTIRDCNNPRECGYSHHLRYEDRSVSKEAKWEKRVPCRFMSLPGGCNKSAEECKFLHEGVTQMRRDARRMERGQSVEFLSEAGPSWADPAQDRARKPPAKKRRGGADGQNYDQGNEDGVRERPRRLTPNWPSRRSSVASSGSAGGPSTTTTTPTRRSRAESKTPESTRWSTRSRSPLRSRSRSRQDPPRHQARGQGGSGARPRTASRYRSEPRPRRDYSRAREMEKRIPGRR